MGLKAVFFDLDDTLYGSFKACDDYGYERLAVWSEQVLGIDGETFTQAFRASRQRMTRQQPGMPPIHDRVVCAQGALERLGCNAIRYARQGHRELLDDLRQAGVKTAVCTDMLADMQMEKLEHLGLADSVDFLVSSEEAGMDKPGAPIFWLALHKCGCTANSAVMVGDNFLHDVQGALDLGIGGVWLNWDGRPTPVETRPYFEAESFQHAADYIRSLL